MISTDTMTMYIAKVAPKIKTLLTMKRKKFVHIPTIFGLNDQESQRAAKTAFEVKQRQMKEGELAQIAIGNWHGWEDLGVGHASGLDCRKVDNSMILELKNRHNTVKGSDIKRSLLPQLVRYKKQYPNTMVGWGIINANPTLGVTGKRETIQHDSVEIEKIQGRELFKMVFTLNEIDYSQKVIDFIRDEASKY